MKKRIDTFWRYRNLLFELVKKGIKLKYRRSYLGIIWSLLEPVMTTIVLTIVFGTLYGNKDHTFPLYILSGRLLYSYFAQGTKVSLKSIRQNSAMIKKVYVPKYLYPLSSVLYNFIIFWTSALHNSQLLLVLLIMTFGVGMILATIGVFFRDMEYLWEVALMIVMYTCAIFYYPERLLKSGYSWVLTVNPVYNVIINVRNIIFHEAFNWGCMTYACVFALVSVVVGVIVFHKNQDKFILYI